MKPELWLMLIACTYQSVAQQDKWVWQNSGRSGKLAGLDAKGKYSVFEPPIPEEPYAPPVRPPPKDFPALVRPFNKFNERPYPNERPYDKNRPFESNRPYESDRPYESNRPYQPIRPNGPIPQEQRPLRPRPYEPSPYEPNRPYETGRPFQPNKPLLPPPHRGEHDNTDPTNFDKCKCTHSFNCKSPGISFGSCDAGKKYCCEKHDVQRGFPFRPVNDGSVPDVLAGPEGPVDHLINKRPPCSSLGCYSNIQERRP